MNKLEKRRLKMSSLLSIVVSFIFSLVSVVFGLMLELAGVSVHWSSTFKVVVPLVVFVITFIVSYPIFQRLRLDDDSVNSFEKEVSNE